MCHNYVYYVNRDVAALFADILVFHVCMSVHFALLKSVYSMLSAMAPKRVSFFSDYLFHL